MVTLAGIDDSQQIIGHGVSLWHISQCLCCLSIVLVQYLSQSGTIGTDTLEVRSESEPERHYWN